MQKELREIRLKILPILRGYGASRAALFGSCVRGQMRRNSDVDILIKIDKDISLLEFVALKLKLEDVLEKRVDLVEYDMIKPMLREKILSEQVIIL